VKGANIRVAARVARAGSIGGTAFSFLYLAVRALLGALVRRVATGRESAEGRTAKRNGKNKRKPLAVGLRPERIGKEGRRFESVRELLRLLDLRLVLSASLRSKGKLLAQLLLPAGYLTKI
jgi:hypothetical protein